MLTIYTVRTAFKNIPLTRTWHTRRPMYYLQVHWKHVGKPFLVCNDLWDIYYQFYPTSDHLVTEYQNANDFNEQNVTQVHSCPNYLIFFECTAAILWSKTNIICSCSALVVNGLHLGYQYIRGKSCQSFKVYMTSATLH